MQNYLIETYVPGSRSHEARRAGRRLGVVAEELGREGVRIRYLRTMLLPEDDTCFHLVQASAPGAVGVLCGRAGLGRTRVVRAMEIT